MNKIAITLLILVAAALAGVGMSFAVDKNISEYDHEVNVGNFHGIDASISVEVEYTRGPLSPVRIVTTEQLMPYVVAEVNGGVLKLGMKKEYTRKHKVRWKDDKVKIYVTAPDVRSFSASTSADIVCLSALSGIDKLTVEASTSGDVKLGRVSAGSAVIDASTNGDVNIEKLDARSVKAEASTSGDISIESVTASTVDLGAYTSGDFKAGNLNCDKMTASVATNGDMELKGRAGNLTVEAATGGDFDGAKLRVEDAYATASVGGSATVNAVRCNSKNNMGGSVKNVYK